MAGYDWRMLEMSENYLKWDGLTTVFCDLGSMGYESLGIGIGILGWGFTIGSGKTGFPCVVLVHFDLMQSKLENSNGIVQLN